jgi:hypothetical protein
MAEINAGLRLGQPFQVIWIERFNKPVTTGVGSFCTTRSYEKIDAPASMVNIACWEVYYGIIASWTYMRLQCP